MKNILLISFIFCFFKANSQTPTCLWAKSINQASTVFFYNIAIDNEDNFIAVGSRCDMNSIDSSLPNSIFDGLFIKKMDSSGNLIWYRTVTSELSEAINPHVVKVDKENNIYMIGQSVGKFYIDSNTYTGYGGIDIFIMKYDKDGNFKWAKILGTSQTDYFMNDAMQVTNEGEVLVTGNIAWGNKDTITEAFFDTIKTTLHSPISRMFIANFDTNGNIKWLKNTTGFASPFSLSVDKNRNIYISGSCLDSVYLDNQMLIKKYDIPNIDNYYSSFILKCDSKGKPIWSKTISLTGSYYEILTTSDSSGNIYVTSISGHIYDTNCYFDGIKHIISKGNFIFKFNTRGNFLWYKNLNNPTFSIIKLDKDNNPILGGSFISKLILDNDTLVSLVQNDGLILKVNNLNGDLIWKKQISGCDIETVNSFAFDKNDRLYISGYYNCDSLQIDDKLIYGSKNSGHIYLAKLYQPIFEIDSIPYSDSKLVLYPNPAYDIVKVNMKNINSDQIRVIDALGRVVKVDVYSNLNQAAINVSSLPTGLYFVLYNDGQKSLNAKLLKE